MLALKFDLPPLTVGDAVAVAHELYGLEALASPLPGEKDLNFLLKTAAGGQYILKMALVQTGDESGMMDRWRDF